MADRPYGTLTILGAVLMIIGVVTIGIAFFDYVRSASLGFLMFAGFIVLFAGFALFSFSRKQRS